MPKDRQTCTQCSMRRQKCDRQQPCTRCVRRGQADKCTTDWGPGGYDPKKHRVYPRTDEEAQADNSSPSVVTSPANASFQQQGRTPASIASGNTPSNRNVVTPPYGFHHSPQQPPPQPGTIDFPSFGKVQLGDYDPRLKSVQILDDGYLQNGLRETGDEGMMSNCFGGTAATQIDFLQMHLPSKRQIYLLVDYQIDQLLWYHVCFHGPTFHAELKDATSGPKGLEIKNADLRWVALLFSIMASSMFSVSDSMALSWGFQREEKRKLTRRWFLACVSCLNLADYMRCHHLYSVQAITILTQSAHVLGHSSTQSTLLGSAMKIAQGLGLQRLALDDDETTITARTGNLMVPAQRSKIIQREVGRRLWAQLCIQDWFSIAFSEMYFINPLHFKTVKPHNMDDSTLEIYIDEVPTQAAFMNYLYDIARLMPSGHDAILASNTLYTKYERVLEWDSKLRQLVTERCPKFLNVREAVDPTWPAWIPWGRRSVMLCYHHKIIMIHRPFLGRSFSEPTFSFSRKACLVASKEILKEAKQAYDEEGPSLWIDQAFMVAAGLTIVLDLFHRREGEPELVEHKKLVETTISMLSKYDTMIGMRGCKMLASLLAEQAKACASNQLGNIRKHGLNGDDTIGFKRQKFDVPRFVEQFVGGDNSFTGSLGASNQPPTGPATPNNLFSTTEFAKANNDPIDESAFSYEKFEQLFPPQAGISNSFLFEDLLNFDL